MRPVEGVSEGKAVGMTTQQTALSDAEGRAAYHAGQDYHTLPERHRSGWKSAATEAADKARRERLKKNPNDRDAWDKSL